jgi:polyhydroxybutyrate depolymerase
MRSNTPSVTRGAGRGSTFLRCFLVLFALLAVSCREGASEAVSTTAAGRRYKVVTKSGHDASKPAAVLVLLHAFWTSPEVLERQFRAQGLAEERDFIVLIPEGKKDSQGRPFWNASLACCDGERSAPDDVGFLRDMLGEVKRRYAVDAKRVYAVGVSNGGFMAHRWACEPGGDVRAFVSISGAASGKGDYRCAPSVGVSVLELHGDADEVVRYGGGLMNDHEHPSSRATIDEWKRLNGCAADAKPEHELYSPLFEFPTDVETWGCARGRVELMTVRGGSHRLRVGSALRARLLAFLEAG